MITTKHIQEQLSRAYVIAVSGVAGINLANVREHDYGVDGTFRIVISTVNARGKTVLSENGFSVDFQLKASSNCLVTHTEIKYDCEADAYNKLVDQNARNGAAPILLLLLCQPKDEGQWFAVTEENLLIRGGCYWMYITGERTTNSGTKRVTALRSQQFTPDALMQIMQTVQSNGGRL